MAIRLIMTGMHIVLTIFAMTSSLYIVGWLVGVILPSGLRGVKNVRAASRKCGLPYLGIGMCLVSGGMVTARILGSTLGAGPFRVLLQIVGPVTAMRTNPGSSSLDIVPAARHFSILPTC
jgi:hypothetical protein